MKKYVNPEANIVLLSLQPLMGASQNPDGFNKNLEDNDKITVNDMLSRRHNSVWDDDEEEDEEQF